MSTTAPEVLDLNVVLPPKRIVKLAGKEIDVSAVPARTVLGIVRDRESRCHTRGVCADCYQAAREGRVFLNPPFGPGVERWFSKLYQERSAGRTTEAIVLWKSATETSAWKTLTAISCQVCFPSTRIRFVGSAGNDSGPTFSPALFYVGDGPERFKRAFAGIGAVWVVPCHAPGM